jgi:hypothetical protein
MITLEREREETEGRRKERVQGVSLEVDEEAWDGVNVERMLLVL